MFADLLELEMTLNIKSKLFNIAGGNIKRVKGELSQYGFQCNINFLIYSEEKPDPIYSYFLDEDIIETHIKIKAHFKEGVKTPFYLELKGIVEEKQIISETVIENIHIKKHPVLCREYFISFKDPAQFFWKRHFPSDLKVNKKAVDLFKDNEVSGIKVKYDLEELNKVNPINTLPLGVEGNQASFYDFMVWYISRYYGGLFYDYEKNEYIISKRILKQGKNFILKKTDVQWYNIILPVSASYNMEFFNVCAEINEKKTISSSQKSYKGLKHSKVFYFPVVSDFERRVKLEKEQYKKKNYPFVKLELKSLPASGPLYPGRQLKFEGELWSKEQFVKNKEFYINEVSFDFTHIEKESESYKDLFFNKFNIKLNLFLSLKENEIIMLPKYIEPKFPMFVEGYVVSDIGEDREETYKMYKDNSGIEFYKVSIPVFDDQEIIVKYIPLFLSGHFYFPIYKGAKVLIGLNMHDAFIERFLDWREGARLPLDTQGNSIIMGKYNMSQVSLITSYDKNKPQLTIKRSSQKDTQIVNLREGVIIFETKEEKG